MTAKCDGLPQAADYCGPTHYTGCACHEARRDAEVERLVDALADLYCARLREGWEMGPTEDNAANRAMHYCANHGVDVFKRLESWRIAAPQERRGER